jgi:hypothetical protein
MTKQNRNKTAGAPAAVAAKAKSPKKSGTPPKKVQSPTKKAMGKITVKPGSNRVRNRICCQAVGHPDTGLTLYWTARIEGCDAFNYPLVVQIDTGALQLQGFHTTTSLRANIAQNMAVKNANNDFNRRCFPRFTDGQSRTLREEGQIILRDILMHPDNNRYGSTFSACEEDDFTTVPHTSPDNVLLDGAIVDIIYSIYDNVDNDWYSRFTDLARTFFTPGRPYPRCAISRLGYPEVQDEVVVLEDENKVLGDESGDDVDDDEMPDLAPRPGVDSSGEHVNAGGHDIPALAVYDPNGSGDDDDFPPLRTRAQVLRESRANPSLFITTAGRAKGDDDAAGDSDGDDDDLPPLIKRNGVVVLDVEADELVDSDDCDGDEISPFVDDEAEEARGGEEEY